jgi:hypothetical protein
MSTRPDDALSDDAMDALLDATQTTGPLSAAVEEHLDRHPLPVAEDVEAAADRLARRIEAVSPPRPPTRWGWALLAAAVAALTLAAAGLGTTDRFGARNPDVPAGLLPAIEPTRTAVPAPSVLPAAPQIAFDRAQRTVAIAPGSDVLSSESERAAVLLVRDGEAWTEDVRIPTGHWALLRRLEDGSSADVVFPDGTAPPPLDVDAWGGTDVHDQLRSLRWQALPDRTTSTLDRILEAP